jgi:hypothetical protein
MPWPVLTLIVSPHSQVSVTRENVGVASSLTMTQKSSISRFEQRLQQRWRIEVSPSVRCDNLLIL